MSAKQVSGEIQLTPNFFLSEFIASNTAVRRGINNTPDPNVVKSLYAIALTLEKVRKVLGNQPIIISSGYRSQALNEAVGGSRTSQHMLGEAVDFVCPKFGTPLQVCRAIVKSGIDFGQLIEEGSWIHLSLPTERFKNQVLTATFVNGKAQYKTGL